MFVNLGFNGQVQCRRPVRQLSNGNDRSAREFAPFFRPLITSPQCGHTPQHIVHALTRRLRFGFGVNVLGIRFWVYCGFLTVRLWCNVLAIRLRGRGNVLTNRFGFAANVLAVRLWVRGNVLANRFGVSVNVLARSGNWCVSFGHSDSRQVGE
jgi:hypothetical protein